MIAGDDGVMFFILGGLRDRVSPYKMSKAELVKMDSKAKPRWV